MRMRRSEHFQMKNAIGRHVESISCRAGHDCCPEGIANARTTGTANYVLFDIYGAMDGILDAVVAGASTKIALQHARQILARILIEGRRGHDHSGGAETALERACIEERLLHRVKTVIACQAFNRRDLPPFRAIGRHQARVEGLAIDMNSARAAIALVATLFYSETAEFA
jgi:hypothetical protein